MKTFLHIFLLTLIVNILTAQDNVIDRYFSEQQEDIEYSKFNIDKKTFSLFTNIKAVSSKEQSLIESIKKLEGIKGLFKEKTTEGRELFLQGKASIAASEEYEELASFSHPDHQGIFMIREAEEKILELMVMGASPEEFGVVTIFGEIDIHKIKDLADVIHANGKAWFDIFENIAVEEIVFDANAEANGREDFSRSMLSEKLELKIYPNPAVDFVILEAVNAEKQNYQLSFFNLIGEPVQAAKNITFPHRLELKDIPSGSYFLRLTDEKGAFKNFKIVKP